MTGCIVFDFDGTLVDSARGILAAMAQALDTQTLKPQAALEPGIIGPPLLQTLRLLSGLEDGTRLAALAAEFKRCYDGGGYRDTDPYAGVDDVLRHLNELGIELLLATNKRGVPTRLILDHLGWTPLFNDVYCLDEHRDCPDKTAMLGCLFRNRPLSAANTPYVGDTEGDAQAATRNGMPFILAEWGYGATVSGAFTRCSHPEQLAFAAQQFFARSHACPAS